MHTDFTQLQFHPVYFKRSHKIAKPCCAIIEMWKYSYIGLIQQGPVQKKRWWSSPHWTASSSSSPLLSSFLVLFLSPFIRLSFFVSFNRVRSRKNVVEQSPLVSLIIWLVSYQSASTSSPLFISFPRSCSRSIFVRFFLFFVSFFCGKSKRRWVHCTLTVVVTPGATGCPPLVTLPPHLATIPTSSHPPQQPTFAPSRSPSSTFYPPFFLHIIIPTYHTM